VSSAPAANVSDVSQTEKLLPGKEESVGADAGYTGVAKRPEEQWAQGEVADRRQSPKKMTRKGDATRKSVFFSASIC